MDKNEKVLINEQNCINDLQICYHICYEYFDIGQDLKHSCIHLDRHYHKRCYDLGKIPGHKKRNIISKWDVFYGEIVELMNNPYVTKQAAYNYLLHKYGKLPGTYNGFKPYTLRKGIASAKVKKSHVFL